LSRMPMFGLVVASSERHACVSGPMRSMRQRSTSPKRTSRCRSRCCSHRHGSSARWLVRRATFGRGGDFYCFCTRSGCHRIPQLQGRGAPNHNPIPEAAREVVCCGPLTRGLNWVRGAVVAVSSNPAVEGTAKSYAFGSLRASRSGCPSLLR